MFLLVELESKQALKVTPCGTRTRNLRIRSPTPCPLGQGGYWDIALAMHMCVPRLLVFICLALVCVLFLQLLIDLRVRGDMRLYSSVVERQSCKLKVLGSIPSGGF